MEGSEMVEVPRALLEELVGYLEEHAGANGTGGGEGLAIDGQGSWTKAKVQAYAELVDAYPAGAALLDALATHAAGGGGIVAVEDLVGQLDDAVFAHAPASDKEKQVSNELGAITKRAVKQLGGKARPMSHSRLGGRLHYKMPKAVGEWWLEVRGS